ncbi:HGxxPAAW family protein [Kocuria sp.]|uniref:HGxxPAAW family protein n=1 Tax=Kocuria sp. TaxID=1871328 RepID=UPI0026DECBBB|nr:HGxxPAAW family protein [Kocuria sp.]MDO5617722.1 HGxxPAAW family protein [Kocuria sp.]
MSNQNEIVLDHTGYVGHGNTPAAWTCIAIMTVGVLVGVVGFTIRVFPMLWVGVAITVVGLIVGFVMKRMGLGYEGEVARVEANGGPSH